MYILRYGQLASRRERRLPVVMVNEYFWKFIFEQNV